MVKPYCEKCGKHRGSNPRCCLEESRRIQKGEPAIFAAAVAVAAAGIVFWFLLFASQVQQDAR